MVNELHPWVNCSLPFQDSRFWLLFQVMQPVPVFVYLRRFLYLLTCWGCLGPWYSILWYYPLGLAFNLSCFPLHSSPSPLRPERNFHYGVPRYMLFASYSSDGPSWCSKPLIISLVLCLVCFTDICFYIHCWSCNSSPFLSPFLFSSAVYFLMTQQFTVSALNWFPFIFDFLHDNNILVIWNGPSRAFQLTYVHNAEHFSPSLFCLFWLEFLAYSPVYSGFLSPSIWYLIQAIGSILAMTIESLNLI